MAEHNNVLDWKKVFKEILNGQKQSAAEKNSCFQACVESSNSGENLENENEKVQKNISSSILQFTSSNNDNSASEDNNYKLESSRKLKSKKLSVDELDLNRMQGASSSTKQKCNFSNTVRSVQVPEWNKAFKSILGNDSSVLDTQVQKNSVKKQENSQKHDDFVNTIYSSQINFHKVPKSKTCPDEEKVRELFALSRLFKLDYHTNLNEFEGAGVDIFKCDRKSISLSSIKECTMEEKSVDESPEQDSESVVPLKGFVANFKPYTTADLIASPSIPFTEEAWDDDLLI